MIFLNYQGKKWAAVTAVKVGSRTEQRPSVDLCDECFSWYEKYAQKIYTVAEFTQKLNSDTKFKKLMDAATELANNDDERPHDVKTVENVETRHGDQVRSWLMLNKKRVAHS